MKKFENQQGARVRLKNKMDLLHKVTGLGNVAASLSTWKQTQSIKVIEETEECFPNKRTRKTFNEMEINNIPDEELKAVGIKTLPELRRKMHEQGTLAKT